MNDMGERRRFILIIVVVAVVLVFLSLIILYFVQQNARNQFGDGIRIQNYDQKVKNLPRQMRDAMEAYLFNIVKENKAEPKSVNDAVIRDDSEEQNYDKDTEVYDGNFIVDMESIKQTYFIQYNWSREEANTAAAGDAIVIICPTPDQLKFGAFECIDFATRQQAEHVEIIQYLPYQNFSFRIYADATDEDNLKILADLRIPEIDLSGNAASRSKVVSLYKGEVMDWIRSKGLNPNDYTIDFNYSDDGTVRR